MVKNIIYKLYICTVNLLPLFTYLFYISYVVMVSFFPSMLENCTVYIKKMSVQKINDRSDLLWSLSYFITSAEMFLTSQLMNVFIKLIEIERY